jgi:hypothetical protein
MGARQRGRDSGATITLRPVGIDITAEAAAIRSTDVPERGAERNAP